MSKAAEPPEEPSREATLQEATALLSSAAKWLIGALGAIGAVLIAGSQLSSIGGLPMGARFVAALIGLAVGLGGVLWAVWRVLDLLAPDRYTISELAAEWDRSGAVLEVGVPDRRLRRRYPVVHWFATNPEHLANHDSPRQLLDHWRDRSAPDRNKVLHAINDMLLAANFRRSRATFERTKAPLAAAMLLAALGIGVFAWAANPGEQPLPALRNADLSDADLSGASLKGVDLTGADLTGADLEGANMVDATLDDVTWDDTTCPDGTNSDDTRGASDSGSCIGHLSP